MQNSLTKIESANNSLPKELEDASLNLLEVHNISKSFMENVVLDDVSISLKSGECLALLGENGAGKSTLIKIITGIYQKDNGKIFLNGSEVEINNPYDAEKNGISVIHQELNLIPNLTVAQNIYFGREPTNKMQINEKIMNEKADVFLKDLGVNIDPKAELVHLSIAEKQLVEIAKALSQNADIIIMDEPTAALSKKEANTLFTIIENLKNAGKGIIYISHRLDEIFKIAHRICVLRDGNLVKNVSVSADVDVNDIVESMVGKHIENYHPKKSFSLGSTALKVHNLSDNKNYYGINFEVRQGEVLGIAGLVGAGQVSMARSIYGLSKFEDGEILFNNKKYSNPTPSDSIYRGMGFISEDRRDEGLILKMNIRENIALSPWAPGSSKIGIINNTVETDLATQSVKDYGIVSENISQEVILLSGGNQQKVSLSKVLSTNPTMIIMCEPTRGVDVNGKVDIYNIMNNLLEKNAAILLISSDIPEVLGMSDRIVVMYNGRITYETKNSDFITEELIMYYATGGKNDK